jgi:hypothetical protein
MALIYLPTLAADREARFEAGIVIDVHDGNVPDAVVGTSIPMHSS